MADEQPKVEQTISKLFHKKQTKKQETKETPVNKFSEEQVNEIVKSRLAKERASMYNKLGVEDLDTAINAVKLQKEAEKNLKFKKVSLKKY